MVGSTNKGDRKRKRSKGSAVREEHLPDAPTPVEDPTSASTIFHSSKLQKKRRKKSVVKEQLTNVSAPSTSKGKLRETPTNNPRGIRTKKSQAPSSTGSTSNEEKLYVPKKDRKRKRSEKKSAAKEYLTDVSTTSISLKASDIILKQLQSNFEDKVRNIIRTDDKDLSPPSRRLDSFARLIEGKGTCTAVCFDGENIIIAANKEGSLELTEMYLNYFRDALWRGSLEEGKITEEEAEMIKLSKEWTGLTQERLERDLLKVKSSLMSVDDKAFSSQIKEAFRNPSKVLIIPAPKKQEEKIHAEMQIIRQLITDKKLNLDAPNKTQSAAYYIGISRLCCSHCTLMVEALNKTVKSAKGEAVVEITDNDLIC